MKPIYVDIHIHTSDDPDSLNINYDLAALKSHIEEIAGGDNYLISFTDHNVINETVYIKALDSFSNLILGVELHICNNDTTPLYHCHMLFNLKVITSDEIKKINGILYQLYPKKQATKSDNVPHLQKIVDAFDKYDFILLPHGGQNHNTFNKSIPKGGQCDTTIERNIYYNHFDGFTARGDKGLEDTLNYFDRLGIKDFVNLVTSSDNYNPQNYPKCKGGGKASKFVPTWMLALPTFDGLRLSLSESSRLIYGEKPQLWSEYIRSAKLQDKNIDIDVNFTPGLNVVIGGSSSGKSLLIDSIISSIRGNFSDCDYAKSAYPVQNIIVDNPHGYEPHYFNQSYISNICNSKNKQNKIQDMPILPDIFPSDSEEREAIRKAQSMLSQHLSKMIDAIRIISSVNTRLKRIPLINSLIISESIDSNPIELMKPQTEETDSINYWLHDYENHIETLNYIDKLLSQHPILKNETESIEILKRALKEALAISKINQKAQTIINDAIKEINDEQTKKYKEMGTKISEFEQLLDCIKDYSKAYNDFYQAIHSISTHEYKIKTKEIQSRGNTLFIENKFELNKTLFLQSINELLHTESQICDFDDILPESLFETNFKKNKIKDYDDFENNIKKKFSDMNVKTYKIITKDGLDFDNLSPGWKTAIILDLILGCKDDTAPLIIDQPEDNLATTYINHDLIDAIKECKEKKQIILVSHNATIPMLGDAQNIILCTNERGHITIRSDVLEGSIDGKKVIDHIADLTDGGKASIKKRIKKYNLKNFRGKNE